VSATLFPYLELQGAVNLTVRAVQLEGKTLPWTIIFQDDQLVELHNPDGDHWASGRIEVELRGPAAELQARKGELVDVKALVVLNCRPSNNRVAVELTPKGDGSTWVGAIDLDRPDWYGQATLHGTVLANIDGVADRQAGFAPPWTIRFDDLPPREIHNAMRIKWVDFQNPPQDLQFLTEYSEDVCFLRIDPDEPRLFLNDAFQGLRALLEQKPRPPLAQRILRDQVFTDIAARTWSALFMAALEAMEMDEDDQLAPPPEDWQRNVLEALLPRLYPDSPPDEARMDAFEARREASGAARLQERLLPAAGQHVMYPKSLRAAIQNVVNAGDEG